MNTYSWPPVRPLNEIELSGSEFEFRKSIELRERILSDLGICNTEDTFTFSRQWGYIIRSVYLNNDSPDGRSYRSMIIFWQPLGEDVARFLVDDFGPEAP
jgi:hypothetical protein